MSFLDRLRRWFSDIMPCHDEGYAEVTVHRGDTMWAIVSDVTGTADTAAVQRYLDEMKRLNPDVDPDMIYPGQRLRVPLDWAE